MRSVLVAIALVGCKSEPERDISVPVSVEEAREQITPSECSRYAKLIIDQVRPCKSLSRADEDRIDALRTDLDDEPACKFAMSMVASILEDRGCLTSSDGGVATADAAPGSRDVPGEIGVPLDRAVLGSLPHPFGALQLIKPTMTREEILAVVPDARRDGEDIKAPLGVDLYTATIMIDTSDHLANIAIRIDAFPSDLFQAAWGETETLTWIDPATGWRADYSTDDNLLQIYPYKPLLAVLGAGPDLLAEKTPLIGASFSALKDQLGGRIDEKWTEEVDGVEVGKPRLLLSSTDLCRYETRFTLDVSGDTVTGATLTQCYDREIDRSKVLAVMEKRWGRATPARTADDRLVFRFARRGRVVEMTEGTAEDSAGAWVVKIRR